MPTLTRSYATLRAPLQERSRRTAERILEAAFGLLSERRFEDVSVAAIAKKAGISVGAFYERFSGKDALIAWFEEHFIAELLDVAERELDPARLEGKTARPVIAAYIEMAVSGFRRHRGVLRQVALRTRTTRDEAFRASIARANRFLHDRLRLLLLARRSEIRHPDPAAAIDLGLTFVSAAMREYVLFSDARPGFAPLDDARLVRELVDAYAAYLRLDTPPQQEGDPHHEKERSRRSRSRARNDARGARRV